MPTVVLINYDEGCRVEDAEEVARYWWSFQNTGAPMDGGGGYVLEKAGPGLLYSRPQGDEMEIGGDSEFIDFPADSEDGEVDAAARWIIDHDLEFKAALFLEELDPQDALTAEQRSEWEDALDEATDGFSVQSYGGQLDAKLAELSDLYRDTRDALASPNTDSGDDLREHLGIDSYL